MKRFRNKRVVITGAGSGLGRTLALDFAKMGWKILVSDINAERMEETAKLVSRAGGQPITARCDVSKWSEVSALAAVADKTWGGVDIVINNAGVPVLGHIEKVPVEDWQFVLGINFLGPVYGCKAFIPLLRKSGGGHIVNVASAAGFISLAEMGPYNATKAAVISLSETLKQELASDNIGVTAACPSFFKTNLMDQVRTTDKKQVARTNAFFKYSLGSAEMVSRNIIRGIRKNRLYVVPQIDAKFYRIFKRICPETFYKFFSFVVKNRVIDRIFGVDKALDRLPSSL